MKLPLDLAAINAHAAHTRQQEKLRKQQKDVVYKQYGFYENYKLCIDSDGMRRFVLDAGFTYDTLKNFLSANEKRYKSGISQAIMYQVIVGKPWTSKVLDERQVAEVLAIVFPDENKEQDTIDEEISQTHEEIMHTVQESRVLIKREAIIPAIKDKFSNAKHFADTISSVPQKEWRNIELLPGMTLREIVDAVVLTGKQVSRPTQKNVSIVSVKELLNIVWDLAPQAGTFHILEKAVGDMLYKKLKEIAPNPVTFCNVFLGGDRIEVAGYPLRTIGRLLGVSKWTENTDATIKVMSDLWSLDASAMQIKKYREDPAVLTADLVENKPPAVLLTDYSLRKLLGIQRPYTKDPLLLRRKINDVLGIIRL